MKISAIVIYDDKANKKLLKKCFDSLFWTDEIIKVNGVKGNFSDWRNEGKRRAKGEWILYVDSDEEVTKELKKEILSTVSNKESLFAYAIPRRNFIFKKEFKHGGLWPDYVKRLFLKSKFKEWEGELHEEPIFDSAAGYSGNLGHLKNPLIHHKNMDIAQMVEKTNEWSEIEAKLMFEAHHPPMNFIRFFTAGFREFWLRMVVQMAFLDGKEGIIYATYQVYSRLISYAKLWEMQQ